VKKLFVPALLTLAIAACGGEPASDTATAPAAKAKSAQAATDHRPLPEALPESVQLAFPYHFRSQRLVDADDGRQRLRLTVEFLDGDVDSTAASLGSSMADAGFEIVDQQALDEGRHRVVYRKKGFGRVNTVIAPKGAQEMRNPAARGTVSMVWPVAEAPASGG